MRSLISWVVAAVVLGGILKTVAVTLLAAVVGATDASLAAMAPVTLSLAVLPVLYLSR